MKLFLSASVFVHRILCVFLPYSHAKHAHPDLLSPRYFTGALQRVGESEHALTDWVQARVLERRLWSVPTERARNMRSVHASLKKTGEYVLRIFLTVLTEAGYDRFRTRYGARYTT